MRRAALAVLAAFLCACSTVREGALEESRAALQPNSIIDVWPGVAPGSEGWRQVEVESDLPGDIPNRVVRNVTHPTLTVYLPDSAKATGTGVIVAPGGGFMWLSINMEGHDVARWLASKGIAAFVLKYRLRETAAGEAEFRQQAIDLFRGISTRQPGAGPPGLSDAAPNGVADAVQALRVVRAHAAEWGVSPDRIGMVGFSAGARVIVGAAYQENPSDRPSFAAPIYGGFFGEGVKVPVNLPPLFFAVAQDDVVARGSIIKQVDQLAEAGYRPELHLFASGGHGFGMNRQSLTSDRWIDEFYWWMQAQGFLSPTKPVGPGQGR